MFGCGGDQEATSVTSEAGVHSDNALVHTVSVLGECKQWPSSCLCARRVCVGGLGDATNITLTLLAFAISVYGVGM